MAIDRIGALLDIADRISRGEVPAYEHNECFTAGAFDLLLIKATGAEAFALLCDVCNRYRDLKTEGANLNGFFYLLSCLVANAQTTELPDGMKSILEENPSLSKDLRRWYRLSG